MTSHPPPLFFQDVVNVPHQTKELELDDEQLSLAFFELANVDRVGYKCIDSSSSCCCCRHQGNTTQHRSNSSVVVQQDTRACHHSHTGGIVWETSYLLLNFLRHSKRRRKEELGRTLEVGAGCGLLGQVLGMCGISKRPVVMTEAPEAMENLERNVQANLPVSTWNMQLPQNKNVHAIARQLDWRQPQRDLQRFPGSANRQLLFDTIVGTDVVFSPQLVEPLLTTLQLASRDETKVYLCLQIRCADSHRLFLEKAGNHGWDVQDITNQLRTIPSCAWGLKMDCLLFQLSRSRVRHVPTSKKRPMDVHHDTKRPTTRPFQR